MKILIITAGILLLLFIFYKIYQRTAIDGRLDLLIAKGAVILDVRTPGEFDDGHIDGAVNIPLSRLRSEYKQLDTGRAYITCCSHGLRSVKAVSILKERGFKKVYNGGPWTELERVVTIASGK